MCMEGKLGHTDWLVRCMEGQGQKKEGVGLEGGPGFYCVYDRELLTVVP